ncbi:hypothetical protein, partial [Chlamydia psittaci]|uniref:hypothetical protein n=1 Tax=Chlamydia psittaci TaxID=83554 RepID=UPI001AD8198C
LLPRSHGVGPRDLYPSSRISNEVPEKQILDLVCTLFLITRVKICSLARPTGISCPAVSILHA